MGSQLTRYGSHLRPAECFAGRITPPQRPADYRVDGSFHGELLSVHKTNTGFTDAPEALKQGELRLGNILLDQP